ncbi:creatininase family protein [Halosegnis marinus]|uniref:Creatininase family protein n=1 Tax=Halosegnis marinus TaxID=3034023 RepID=A0ABD5ZRC1_9EURY|nr:creatininase family protein [Halosegnis sp. DT85]
MHLARETTRSVAEADPEVAVLPVGSTEQHGPHLPLGTDHLVAEAFADALDRADSVVLPTLPVGVSDHHRQFHGTLSLSPETFERAVRETVASLAEHGTRKVVLLNGHGGNDDALRRAARTLRREETAFAVPWNWWDGYDPALAEDLLGEGLGHANAVETSMVLHVARDLVDEERVADAEATAAESWGREVHGADVGFDTADFSEGGAVGTPTAASADAGKQLFDASLAELTALVDWLAAEPFADLLPEPHR